MRIEKRKISELIKAEYNPRKISVVQLQELKDGIEEFGLVSPLVVNEYTEKKNVIVVQELSRGTGGEEGQ